MESPKSQLCTMFSQESNESPIGSGFSWEKCLVVEVATPWNSQITESKHFPEGLETILNNAEKINEVAYATYQSENFLYLGRGMNFPIALEGALKLKEISYIHAEGYPAAEMKHGPIALIDENMPVVFIAPNDETFSKVLSNIQEVKARNGVVIALTDHITNELKKVTDYIIEVPKSSHPRIFPILASISLQLLAYQLAVLRGCDIDRPRNLAKSVTVE